MLLSSVPRSAFLLHTFHTNAPHKLSPQKACRGVRRLRQQFSPLWRKFQCRKFTELTNPEPTRRLLSRFISIPMPRAFLLRCEPKTTLNAGISTHREVAACFARRPGQAILATHFFASPQKIVHERLQICALQHKCERSSRCERSSGVKGFASRKALKRKFFQAARG